MFTINNACNERADKTVDPTEPRLYGQCHFATAQQTRQRVRPTLFQVMQGNGPIFAVRSSAIKFPDFDSTSTPGEFKW